MNQPFKAKAHETKIRWWPAFTPPQSPAHAALRGLFSLRRSYVGPLRWCAPEPPDPWEGVRPAKQFGPIAIQTTGACFNLRETRQSEDCLSLNIWTASLDREILQPVMLWIHGGGNLGGSGSEDAYDGASLARRGVTVVTINYRLGPSAFSHIPTPARILLYWIPCGSRMDRAGHPGFWRRSGQCHGFWAICRSTGGPHSAFDAPGPGALPSWHHAERLF